jgi:putative Mg2+ transporter-C (MgtC) family protein
VRGIKAAAAVWITGAIGLAIGTSFWWLGITVGFITAAVMFISDRFPDAVREEKQEGVPPPSVEGAGAEWRREQAASARC